MRCKPPSTALPSPTLDTAPAAERPAPPTHFTTLRELRHEPGNALTPTLGHAQRLCRAVPDWATDDDREMLDAVRENVGRALWLLEGAVRRRPERCELVAILGFTLAALPQDRFRDTAEAAGERLWLQRRAHATTFILELPLHSLWPNAN